MKERLFCLSFVTEKQNKNIIAKKDVDFGVRSFLRGPCMLFSRIRALGISFDVFPVSNMPREPHRYRDATGSATTVFLLPSIECDARIVMLEEDGDYVADRIAASVAAAVFLFAVRGLPLDEISVETDKGREDIEIAENGKKYYVWKYEFRD